MGALGRIFWLGLKEFQSLRSDYAMAGLLVYAFTIGVYMDATAKTSSVNNVSIAIVDEDGSAVSRALADAFRPPEFNEPVLIPAAEADGAMDGGQFIFILGIPPGFERDLRARHAPELQLLIDATAMEQAGLGAGYIQVVLTEEIRTFAERRNLTSPVPVGLITQAAFNPNRDPVQFQGVVSLISHISILAIILTGAALIREREHGTIEHLLAMPISPLEVALAKIWANAAVVMVAALLSTLLILEGFLDLTFAGSRALFYLGTTLYLFSAAALGVFLATIARSMAQFSLLFFLVILPMQMLSGADTPIENQPDWLQPLTQLLPSRHFVSFGQAIIFKGADFSLVWREFAALAALGLFLLVLSLALFRRTLTGKS